MKTIISGVSLGIMALGVLVACERNEMPAPSEGAMLFAENCAVCHGAGGKGAGATAQGLTRTPPDLTTLAQQNGGVFPRAEALSTIDGYSRGTHAGRVMPEFGALLRGDTVPVEVDGVLTPTPRPLAALLAYLEDIQS